MENIHRSLPNRSSNGGGYASSHHHKSVYDDVFGGPPRFSGPALAPRREDYVEIFAGASRSSSSSSSIPVLDIPAIDDESELLRFDVRFDYAEVFGECRAFDWTASFEDIVAQSSGGYDSSNEAWSPSQSGSLSDELDPLGGSDTTHGLPDGDAHQSLQSNSRQFNISYNKTSQRVSETVLTGTRHVTKFGAAPGDTSSHETSVPSDGEHENCIMHVAEDINRNKELGGRAPTEEQYIKCSSNPLYNGFDKLVDDINPSEPHVDFSSSLDRPFITISDISLRTKPSRLPPPSRPPPALAPRNVGCGGSISKVKPSESYTFNGLAEGSVPPVFDREDANLSAESMSPGNKNLRAKRDCSEESIERKEVQSHTKGHLEDVKAVKNKMNKMVGVDSSFQGDYVLQLNGKETEATSFEGRVGSSKSTDKLSDMQGGQHCDYIADRTAGDVAGREAMEYFEVVGNDIHIEHFEAVENYNSRMQSTNQEAYRHLKSTDFDLSNQMEDVKKPKVTKEVPRWDNKRLETKRDGDDLKNEKQHTRKLNATLGGEIEFHENVTLNKLSSMDGLDRMMPGGAQQPEESGIQHMGTVKEHLETKHDVNGVETNAGPNSSFKRVEMEKKFAVAQTMAEGNGNHKETIVKEECQSVPDVSGAETRELPKKIDHEGTEKQQNMVWMKENGNKMMESDVLKDEMMVEMRDMHGSAKTPCTAVVHERGGNVEISLEVDKDKEMLMEDGKPNVNEVAYTRAFRHSGNYKEQNLAPEWEALKGRKEDAFKREVKKSESKLGTNGGFFEIKADEHSSRYTVIPELSGQPKGSEPLERNRHETEDNWDLESDVIVEGDQLRELDGACELDKGTAARVARKHDNRDMLETAEEAFSCEDNIELKTRPHFISYESEGVMHDPLTKVKCNKFSKNYDEFRDGKGGRVKYAEAATILPKHMRNLNIGCTGSGFTRVVTDNMASATSCNHEAQNIISNEDGREQKIKGSQAITEEVNSRDSFILYPAIRAPVVNERRAEDAPSILEHDQGPIYSTRNASQQSIEGNDKKMKENLAANRRETELENERMRKIEEEREREREREKDRMAVDKATLERSYSGERVSGEVRQKAMAEARERLEKTSMEARFRAERAAVERATAEARQRAVEKSMAEKAAFDARGRVEKSVPYKFSAIHRPADTRQSSLSSELHFQNTGTSNGLRHSYFPANVGAEGESPQRSKARLERYRRTAERAANALAEKNTRDLLAQKEREERNRVAEVLDAEVRRWSSGKEGNLRALLSTLQYILGPNSGWQPVPLTEVITSAAVKKAYRKATLCVHPDKLQQRGATVQQKYICVKVFDLLKDAWNKFNSEER